MLRGKGIVAAAELGEAIAALRGRRTQAAVARQAGLSRASWSLYELGRRRPRSRSLERVLEGLGCTREDLEVQVLRIRRRALVETALAGAFPPTAEPEAWVSPGEPDSLARHLGSGEGRDPLPIELRFLLQQHLAAVERMLVYLVGRAPQD